MKRVVTQTLLLAALTAAVPAVAQHATATYRMPIEDQGILVSPSKPGEPFYESDGNGMREPNIYRVGDTYYLFYDGAATHYDHKEGCTAVEKHLWRTCVARSTDLKNWEKLGPKLRCAIDDDPQGEHKGYRDFWSASSAWLYFDKESDHWYAFYLGAEGAAPAGQDMGTPGVYYTSCLAKAATKGEQGIAGDWIQENRKPGKEKSVLFYRDVDGGFTQGITVPGPVIINPKWKGKRDKKNKKYMMFATCGANIAIIRSNNLDGVQDWDGQPNPGGWMVDRPILGPVIEKPAHGFAGVPETWENIPNERLNKTAPENANYYYDPVSGYHFMFTNQFSQNYTYTDCNVVYWTKDIDNWDDAKSAVVVDGKCTRNGWATGAIGFPSVVRVDDETLLLVYDAMVGSSIYHTPRVIGYGYWKIPKLDKDGNPVDPVFNN